MIGFLVRRLAEKNKQIFIRNCEISDAPRLAEERFPAGCKAEMDIVYKDGSHPLKLDIYTPFASYGAKECFILIHGGAFVYGSKRLDQNFGMHLALKAGIPVVNVDYTLMPDSDISQIINEIFHAMNFISSRYGIRKFHTVGDSAGGYLAYIVAVTARSRHIRHGVWVFEKLNGTVESAGMICPGVKYDVWKFPAIYFEKQIDNKNVQLRLPDYIYNLNLIAERDTGLRVAVITGEDDFLREQGYEFKEHIENVLFYEAKNEGELKMFHVFPVAHPEWPQSVKAIDMIAENAVGRR